MAEGGIQVSFDLASLLSPVTAPIATLLGPAAREFGEMLGDRMRVYRFQNLASVLQKVERIAAERKIPPAQLRALPFGDALRTVEAASLEEEETVQELWARLLANAADARSAVTASKAIVELLKSLSGPEATLLSMLFWADLPERTFHTHEEVAAFNAECDERARHWRELPASTRRVSEQNLVRLRCILMTPRFPQVRGLVKGVSMRRSLSREPSVEIDDTGLMKVIDALMRHQFTSAGIEAGSEFEPLPLQTKGGWGSFPGQLTAPELKWMLTSLGVELMRACASPPPVEL